MLKIFRGQEVISLRVESRVVPRIPYFARNQSQGANVKAGAVSKKLGMQDAL